jgi:hypothetical protein
MGKVLRWFGGEIREILPAFVFFSVVLCVVVATDALYVRGISVKAIHIITALILALTVSKAILLANALPFIDAFPRHPLVYNTAWKTAIYTVAAVLIYFLERAIEAASHHHSLWQEIGSIPWSRFWMVIIWLLVGFVVFVGYVEVDRRLGGRLKSMFFGRPAGEQE